MGVTTALNKFVQGTVEAATPTFASNPSATTPSPTPKERSARQAALTYSRHWVVVGAPMRAFLLLDRGVFRGAVCTATVLLLLMQFLAA